MLRWLLLRLRIHLHLPPLAWLLLLQEQRSFRHCLLLLICCACCDSCSYTPDGTGGSWPGQHGTFWGSVRLPGQKTRKPALLGA